ncbi:hypothetical protein PV327_007426 [Microctonus hyperodae]|uniref:Uncharacterized protein n=1 Tax=Microctonus hyperodae TaxID=165561 RepID=A0AA39FZ55_MICHY|nr:hypothetical protein PV327_007426 [Microctonus hyperodae]
MKIVITESEFDEATKELCKKVQDVEGWQEAQSSKRKKKNCESTITAEQKKHMEQQETTMPRDKRRDREDPTKSDENNRNPKQNTEKINNLQLTQYYMLVNVLGILVIRFATRCHILLDTSQYVAEKCTESVQIKYDSEIVEENTNPHRKRIDKEGEEGPSRTNKTRKEAEKKRRKQISHRIREEKRARRTKREMGTEWQEGDSTGVSSWETGEEEDKKEIPATELNPKKRTMEKTNKDTIMNLMAELMTHIEQDQELRNLMRKMMMIMSKRNEEEKESTKR